MSRRLHSCTRCPNLTRHDDRQCSKCRHRRFGRFLLVPKVADPNAPTVAELHAGIDLSCYLRDGATS